MCIFGIYVKGLRGGVGAGGCQNDGSAVSTVVQTSAGVGFSTGLGRQGLLHPRTFPPALAPAPSAEWSRWRVGGSIIMVSSVVAYGERTSLLRFWLSPSLTKVLL